MAGTKFGGIKAAVTNKQLHGEDFYKRIGAKGGRKTGVPKGFAANPALAKIAGRKGGSVTSGRGKAKKVKYEDERVNYQSY
jgi:general stress protein YciG